MKHTMNDALGSQEVEHSFEELIDKIRGFDHEGANISDKKKLCSALEILAREITSRYERVAEMERKLGTMLSDAELNEMMAGVLRITQQGNPPDAVLIPYGMGRIKRFWWPR